MYRLEVRRTVLHLTPVYICAGCGAEGLGDTVTREYDGEAPPVECIRDINNSAMPVGWASYYDLQSDRHLCPNCK